MIRSDERIDEVNENLRLIQKKNGLTFGTDAYLLYAYMRPKKNAVAVDLGAGTGIISLLSLAKDKYKTVTAVEIQSEFAELIERNACLNQLEGRLSVVCKDMRELSAATLGREVDVVFSNPPYMKVDGGKVNRDEIKSVARHEMFGGVGDFCKAASLLLKYGGSFYAVYRPDRLTELLKGMIDANLEPKRMTYVHADSNHTPSLVLVEAKKGGSVGLFVTKPLLLKDCSGNDTDEIRFIYQNGVFQDEYARP